MASTMSSLYITVSGLRAAQTGLTTVGHNISNSETTGYTRQGNIQTTSSYLSIGSSNTGCGQLLTGLGTDVAEIRQIRNKYLDNMYRSENMNAGFYGVKYSTGTEIESILGELESDYRTQDTLEDLWESLNNLTFHPDGVETRDTFIENCSTFLTRVQNIYDTLYNYQLNLNEQVKEAVSTINDIVEQINVLNGQISKYEASGQNANDYRDSRNVLLDELSSYVGITVKERTDGSVDIICEGKELLSNGVQTRLGLRYTSTEYPFVEPVLTSQTDILAYGTEAKALYSNLDTEVLEGETLATSGSLKGLLVSRGNVTGNYTTDDSDVANYMIPTVQKELDTLVHSVVEMINEALCPTDGSDLPYNLLGEQTACPVFIRKSSSVDVTDPEDEDSFATLYSITNLEINPLLLQEDGYNYLSLSRSGDVGDTDIITELAGTWKDGVESLDGLSIDSYYTQFVTNLSIEVSEAKNYYETEQDVMDTVENQRSSISGVSLDEELTNMLKYQHAYNAAAKVLNVVNSMIDKVVNGTGRVGL